MRKEQHIWGREQRRDGASEWPSTGFSTLSGELRDSRAARSRRRRRRRSSYMNLAVPFLLVLALGGVGMFALARHLQG